MNCRTFSQIVAREDKAIIIWLLRTMLYAFAKSPFSLCQCQFLFYYVVILFCNVQSRELRNHLWSAWGGRHFSVAETTKKWKNVQWNSDKEVIGPVNRFLISELLLSRQSLKRKFCLIFFLQIIVCFLHPSFPLFFFVKKTLIIVWILKIKSVSPMVLDRAWCVCVCARVCVKERERETERQR